MFTVLPQLRRRLSSKRFLGRGHTDKRMQAEDTVRPVVRPLALVLCPVRDNKNNKVKK